MHGGNRYVRRPKRHTGPILCALFLILLSPVLQAENLYERAEELARVGDIKGMEQAYDQLLKNHPDDIRARTGRGTARSWQGKSLQAQVDFEYVLRRQPDNLDALVGLGYDLAWQGHYEESRIYFEQALSIAPENSGASKGLAYSYLWAGDHFKALSEFETIAEESPEDAEVFVGIGQARLELGHAKRSALAFENAKALDPARTDAAEGVAAAYGYPALVELDLWVGNTSSTDETGIRLVEIASSITPDIRLWARYDNSLSLDNPSLARSGAESETVYVGSRFPVYRNTLATVEGGYRRLPDDKYQAIAKGEVTHFFETQSIKFGAQFSPHSDGYTDSLLYTGYGFPISSQWRLTPTVFYSSTGQDRDKEYRVLVESGYRAPGRWTLNLGAAFGGVDSSTPGASGNVYVTNAELRLPVAAYHSLNFALRYENNPQNEFTIAMIGMSLRWPRY